MGPRHTSNCETARPRHAQIGVMPAAHRFRRARENLRDDNPSPPPTPTPDPTATYLTREFPDGRTSGGGTGRRIMAISL